MDLRRRELVIMISAGCAVILIAGVVWLARPNWDRRVYDGECSHKTCPTAPAGLDEAASRQWIEERLAKQREQCAQHFTDLRRCLKEFDRDIEVALDRRGLDRGLGHIDITWEKADLAGCRIHLSANLDADADGVFMPDASYTIVSRNRLVPTAPAERLCQEIIDAVSAERGRWLADLQQAPSPSAAPLARTGLQPPL